MENEGYIRTDAKWNENAQKLLEDCVKGDPPLMTVKERDLIDEFSNTRKSTMGYSRYHKTVSTTIRCRKYFGDYTKVVKRDLERGMESMRLARESDGTPHFTGNSIRDYWLFVKRFLLWLIEEGHIKSDLTAKQVNSIVPPKWTSKQITEEELVTQEDVDHLIQACNHSRDRAYISIAYEGALRMVDVCNIQWKHIEFPENPGNPMIITAKWKTGKERKIPCYSSISYLAKWRDDYPRNFAEPKGDAFVFVKIGNDGHGPTTYRGMAKVLKGILNRSEISGKEITPHLFRHGRITEWMRSGDFTDMQVCIMGFGNKDTRQLSVYSHLVHTDNVNSMADFYGVERPDKKKKARLNVCGACSHPNPTSSSFCNNCGNPLKEDAKERMMDLNTILAAIRPEIEMEMNRMLEEKRINLDNLDVA